MERNRSLGRLRALALGSCGAVVLTLIACSAPPEARSPEEAPSRAPAPEVGAAPSEVAAPSARASEPVAETNAATAAEGNAGASAAKVEESRANEAPASAPWPRGTKVLHVGDSFAGALGVPLGKRLEAAGLRSVLKHVDASYLTTWAWEKDLQKHLDRYQPDLVLVTLGANELAITEPEQRVRAIEKIVQTIGERPCVWVAIPLWAGKHNALLDVIRAHVSPCRYLDTNALVDVKNMPRIADGIHPTTSARESWAGVVFDWLAAQRDPNGARPWSLRAD